MILQRIKEYLDKKGITIAAFEKSIGMSNASFGKSLKRNGAIGTDKLENILKVYTDISPSWLLTGEGKMFKTKCNIDDTPSQKEIKPDSKDTKNNPDKQEVSTEFSQPNKLQTQIQKQPAGSQEGIPLIPLSAMAGAFTTDITVMEYECERYIVPAFKGADFLIPVKGDSMQPTYLSGDLVACQKLPLTDIFFQWNKTYVLDTDQGALIKRVCHGSDEDHILLVSDNANYPPFELPISQLHAIALVRGIIRLE